MNESDEVVLLIKLAPQKIAQTAQLQGHSQCGAVRVSCVKALVTRRPPSTLMEVDAVLRAGKSKGRKQRQREKDIQTLPRRKRSKPVHGLVVVSIPIRGTQVWRRLETVLR